MKYALLIFGVLFGSLLNGQLFIKGGNTVLTVLGNCTFYVDDSLVVDNGASLLNSGELKVNGHIKNQGLFTNSQSVDLSGNFIQNGTHNSTSDSDFLLSGTGQEIMGSGIVEFGNFICSGDGEKTLSQTVSCSKLAINSSRINTQTDSLIVLADLPDAISRNSGWVYSEQNGGLFRNLSQGQLSDFPVGSATQYRPLKIGAPNSSGQIGLRFADVSAADEGIPLVLVSPEICKVDDRFYFRIYGNIGEISIESNTETSFLNGFQPWAFTSVEVQDQWNISDVNSVVLNDSLTTQWDVILQNGLAISPYLERPSTPEIFGPDTLCINSPSVIYEAVNFNNGFNYLWSASGGQVTGSSTTNEIAIDWESSTIGNVSLMVSDTNGCSSFPASLNVLFNPRPEAAFTVELPDYPSTGENISFVNQSIGGVAYFWNFGNGEVSSVINPFEDYSEPGTYIVELKVQDENGCRDSVRTEVQIPEDLIFPDAFSPNGDGINDFFQIQSSGINDYSLQIFDRWGNQVFESSKPGYFWNGRTSSGTLVPAGTYFVLLRAAGSTKIFEKRTSISVFY